MTLRSAILGATLAVGLLYVALLAWALPGNGLWSGDQGAKLVQVVSLIQHRFQSGVISDPSAALDPEGRFSALPALFTWRQGGGYYSIFSYPHAALTAPWFFLFGYAGLYVVPVVATLSTLALGAALSARLGVRHLWAIPFILGVATPVGFYALVFWEHALATGVATAALLCAALSREPSPRARRYALPAGLLAGMAWWFRAECLWLGPALLIGLAVAGAGRRGLAWAAAGLAAGILPMALFNLLIFGLPLGPQVAVNFTAPGASTPAALLAHRSSITIAMLLDSPGAGLWLAAASTLALASAWAGKWRLWLLMITGLLCLSYLLGPGTGILHTGLVAACPLALLALSGCRPEALARPPIRLLLAAATVFMVGVLLTAPNDGGSQWGPRYLLPVLPSLVIAGLATSGDAARPPRLARSLALAVLAGAGLLAQAQGLQTLRNSTTTSLRLVQVVNAQPAQPILTDIWYAPQLLAPIYFERSVLLLPAPDDLPAFSVAMHTRGIDRFSYLTSQAWGRDTQLPAGSGATCRRVERMSYGLTLLDCAIAETP